MVDSNILTIEKIESIIEEVKLRSFDNVGENIQAMICTNKENISLIKDAINWSGTRMGSITIKGIGQVKIQVIDDLEYDVKIFFFPQEPYFIYPIQ